ncbi:CLUMA_CG009139, isoform A [Clunio marinus]|uniref:CLUMA_CG009139, isoform A n=1 Tax=Clunio marinus TaxID=568069 RepID=A0A1J1IB62_9DIPT|nr:CLUMA_CG009139, isoform A [Clunio marinus]
MRLLQLAPLKKGKRINKEVEDLIELFTDVRCWIFQENYSIEEKLNIRFQGQNVKIIHQKTDFQTILRPSIMKKLTELIIEML